MAWKRVCSAGDIAVNAVKKFDVDGVPVLIANYGTGFRAIPPSCPHMEEPLLESGVVAGCVLTCTKHLWGWDLRTLEMQGETEKPIKTYELKQEHGEIFVFIDRELVYDFDDDDEFDGVFSKPDVRTALPGQPE
jgi:toluene monooxygenase system ferredoxin subunit